MEDTPQESSKRKVYIAVYGAMMKIIQYTEGWGKFISNHHKWLEKHFAHSALKGFIFTNKPPQLLRSLLFYFLPVHNQATVVLPIGQHPWNIPR